MFKCFWTIFSLGAPDILITSFQKPVGGKLSQAAYIFDCVTSYLVMLAFKSKIKSWLDWNLIMVYTTWLICLRELSTRHKGTKIMKMAPILFRPFRLKRAVKPREKWKVYLTYWKTNLSSQESPQMSRPQIDSDFVFF